MKLRLDTPILDAIDAQLKNHIRAFNLHMQLEIQIVEFDALGGGEAGEEPRGDGAEVGGEFADVDEGFVVGVGGFVALAGNEVVFDDQRLPRSEVARVVEGDGLVRGDGCPLIGSQ